MDPNYPNNYNPNTGKGKGKSVSTSRGKREPMKVKYISSPIMVQASNESEFRAVVQELTGKDSPGTHPDTTTTTTDTTTSRGGGRGGGGSGGDGRGGGGSSNYSSGFHQNMMTWKDY